MIVPHAYLSLHLVSGYRSAGNIGGGGLAGVLFVYRGRGVVVLFGGLLGS